jgi:hypothetical protein
MNANNEQNNSKISWTPTKGKLVLLILVGVIGLFGWFAYFNLYIMPMIFAILAFFFSFASCIRWKRVSLFSILSFVTGFLFLISVSIWRYGDTLSNNAMLVLNQFGSGFFSLGLGFSLITYAATVFDLNKSGLVSKYSYPRHMIIMSISGFSLFGAGIYSLVTGLQNWKIFLSIMSIR